MPGKGRRKHSEACGSMDQWPSQWTGSLMVGSPRKGHWKKVTSEEESADDSDDGISAPKPEEVGSTTDGIGHL